MATSRFDKKASDHIPWAGDQGHDFLVGANEQKYIQSALVVQSGAAPLVVNLAASGLKNMADASYVVIAQIEGVAATVDETTKTTTGFNVLLGSDTEVCNLLIIGRTEDQPAS